MSDKEEIKEDQRNLASKNEKNDDICYVCTYPIENESDLYLT